MRYPLISVVVPVYGVEKYLRKCVDSLIIQDYPNYEILLIDDGSPDECPTICDEFSKIYDYVRTYHKDNGGLSDARNYGIRHASGDWIVFVDSDDYVLPNYLTSLWYLKEKFQADMSMAWVMRVDESGRQLGVKYNFDDFCISGSEAIYEIYGKGVRVGWNAYNKLYPKSFLLSVPFPDGYYEDMACMYKILYLCAKVAIGAFNHNYLYVQRPNSILNNKLSAKHFLIFEICEEFLNFSKQHNLQYKLLNPIIYARSVIQMFHSQLMDKDSFERVFLYYRALFRSNILRVVFAKGVNYKFKLTFLLLCTTPSFYHHIRHIKFLS